MRTGMGTGVGDGDRVAEMRVMEVTGMGRWGWG